MAEIQREQRELVLAPNEFCYVQNNTDGGIVTCVGPLTVTLGQSEAPIIFDPKTKRFVNVNNQQGKVQPIQQMIFAPAGWYVVMLNPTKKYPQTGKKNTPEELEIGKRIVIPGPVSFALWPGQMAQVIEGHRLRSNEYLLIEIYDDVAARTNWSQATIQTVTSSTDSAVEKNAPKTMTSSAPADLANGKRYIIKGTEVAFYLPPTGVKVVEDDSSGKVYVRRAVSLENLEYAILLDENGEKEYLYGPNVVFPKPTQTFIQSNGKTKYKAIELDARKGLFIKVIEDYVDKTQAISEEGALKDWCFKAGEELFITGDGIIYMPRKEHSIIKYGDQEIHYAIAIPEGEGWYVLNRKNGEVSIVRGPKMYLPDPREFVITRRILSEKESNLFYPDNKEVLEVNKELMTSSKGDTSPSNLSQAAVYTASIRGLTSNNLKFAEVEDKFGGDSFERSAKFTKPRTIILDTKYMGAIPINVWTGYAVKVIDKTGSGRVEIGPKAFLLEYDETLEPMSLSTGKPKNTDKLFNTVYLKTKSNRVSDIIEVDTIDMIKAKIKVSYRVDFINEDNPIKWFSVENYVKLLCDHARSIIKSVVRKITILDLHFNLTDIIRNSLLGKKEVAENATKERLGMLFEENNMKVYDIEVLDLEITNTEINKMILDAERRVFSNVLALKSKQHEATTSKELTILNTQIIQDTDEIEKARAESKSKKQTNEFIEANEDKKIKDALLAIEDAKHKQNVDHQNEELKIHILRMQSEVEASTKIAYAFTPNMVQAINNLKDATVLESLSENFKDLAILQGQGILATATRFLDIIPQGLLDTLGQLPLNKFSGLNGDIQRKS